ncbi:MAG: arginine--tRNA ligase [Acidobacteria bacterium]|jgi:arginyl-tRNA synthetase|nr:arginine--tRNA ligase [Acidobacteriota bacterium]
MIDLFSTLRDAVAAAVRAAAPAADPASAPAIPIEFPPDPALGDLATPAALGLARALKRPPRQIAEQLAPAIAALPGVAAVEIAGPGYVNVRIDRTAAVRTLLGPEPLPVPGAGKTVVEHTNINPNKAAHIGHLRNAVLGDTLVRSLAALGERVEVQNYIDDTGVQVADAVVGLTVLEGLDEAGVRARIDAARDRSAAGGHGFDYELWDLYARVTQWYEADRSRESHRQATLHALERREGPTARIGSMVATEILTCHLRTMQRLGIRYQLLPRESDILGHRFWETAFGRLKQTGTVALQAEGKAAGCWVMNLPHADDQEDSAEYEKIIVRSDGTVTYVGKDIAYQLWKFGLLGADFDYRPFAPFQYGDGSVLWETAPAGEGVPGAPSHGGAARVINVIDVRQAYLQRVVKAALERLGYPGEAERSIHFSYEMVALSPETALALQPGLVLSDEDRKRPWLDMSGRKGLGVKADDLLDRLETKALEEVRQRNPELPEPAARELARIVAVGAVRYYMLRFARKTIVAFDIDAALAFEGETGPYSQYAAVRVSRILDKLAEKLGGDEAAWRARAAAARFERLPAEVAADHWALVHRAARLPEAVRQATASLEFSTLAKYAFELAQAINAFYHRYPVLQEPDEAVRDARLAVLLVADRALRRALDLMGVPVPSRM